ncbi:xanthine dehydrogenase 1-like [Chelonus insularis]|uniref:xanthine dehydrogenase 1-like n=1 Tax=Chelonus insularis TaxID=460826 RepID=UPI00158B0B6C|nr:xanthine dehydrogenase 1-like [Chelonus insularis]
MGQAYTFEGPPKDHVEFTINGVLYQVKQNDLRPDTTLNVFIRDHAKLRGTKSMCHEGGCGTCIVAAEIHGETLAVNSCLVPVLICNGWEIKTVEGIGNKKIGYHKVQTTLAGMNGSQCGYCSPGMVMNMYSLLESNKDKLSMKKIENSFGGNICRCTGYRPILDAFKGLASDADPHLSQKIADIEEVYKWKTCPKTGVACKGSCGETTEFVANPEEVHMVMNNVQFHKVLSVENLFNVFQNNPDATYILYGGNTAHGVYRSEQVQIYIDVNDITDLHRVEKDDKNLTFGGNVTLSVAKHTLKKYSKEPGFQHLQYMANHIDLIANVPVRNIGTLAGNLMIKHKHREFPSDLFLMLETAGAEIHILDSPANKTTVNFMDFLQMDMKHKIIYSIVIPALSSGHVYRSYKIMPRAQNAHAHVNAGFLFKLDSNGMVLEKPNIIFGGIRSDFLHASATEDYLNGKSLFDKSVFKQALNTLDSELKPDRTLPDYSPEFRKTLAEGLLYKFVLGQMGDSANEKLRSGGHLLKRDLSSAKHDYDTDKNLWPVNKPLPKIESIHQTSGEAQYANDVPPHPHEVFCAFVVSEVANGMLENVDASEALAMEGVVAFFSAKDVPGENLSINAAQNQVLLFENELLFIEDVIQFAGQPIGIIAAETQALANEAVKKVKVTYRDALKTPPVITVKDALTRGDTARNYQIIDIPASRRGNDVVKVIKGEFEIGHQYHFTMEPQSCVCIPTEDGLDVYPTSQWMDLTQGVIADCLGIPQNKININVRRLGGGYGAKISRNAMVSCACALVSYLLNRPARLVLNIESNMMIMGKRPAARQEYEVGVDAKGIIQYLNFNSWHNSGHTWNEFAGPLTSQHVYTCYDGSPWNVKSIDVQTDIPSNTYCRGPGSVEGVSMVETIMENIAKELGLDPTEVRLGNMEPTSKESLSKMIEDLKVSSDYETRIRSIRLFNNENRWRKRGMSLIPLTYPLHVFGQYNVLLSVYARDGTVSIVHGGIEMGQGLHTKVAQVAAYTLGIDLDMINVKPSNNMIAPNNVVTGGSIGSESCAAATIKACEELLQRLAPVKAELSDPDWQELVLAAYEKNISLTVHHMLGHKQEKKYDIYGVTVAEVEIDVLTGQHLIRRVDLLEDVGTSMNPEIDLGQAEGAYVMGIGYWTSEDIIYDPKTGLLVNYRTWNYKPPGAKDIPIDFRVYFRRNAPNPNGVLRSKAVGEPPICMSYGIVLAIRNALESARKDAGNTDPWFQLDGPVTTERILLNSLTSKELMTF